MEKNEHHTNTFWFGFFLGGLLGALLILLLGNEKGKKLAEKLRSGALDFLEEEKVHLTQEVEKIQDIKETVMEEVSQLPQDVAEATLEKVDEVKAHVAREAVIKADQALAHIEALQERGRRSTAELRRQLFKNIPKKPHV